MKDYFQQIQKFLKNNSKVIENRSKNIFIIVKIMNNWFLGLVEKASSTLYINPEQNNLKKLKIKEI